MRRFAEGVVIMVLVSNRRPWRWFNTRVPSPAQVARGTKVFDEAFNRGRGAA